MPLLPALAAQPCGRYRNGTADVHSCPLTFLTRPATPRPSVTISSVSAFAFVCSFILFLRSHIPARSSHLNLPAPAFPPVLGPGPPFLREAFLRLSPSLSFSLPRLVPARPLSVAQCGCLPVRVSSRRLRGAWPLLGSPELGGGPQGRCWSRGLCRWYAFMAVLVLSPCRLPSPLCRADWCCR